MNAEDPLESLARSILEGAEVDWDLAEAEAESGGEAGRIRALREVARVAAFHRDLQREEPEEDAPGPEPSPAEQGLDPTDRESGP
jgi:hypothetical protein